MGYADADPPYELEAGGGMSEFPIEDVHRLLDGIEEVISDLQERPETIDVAELGDFCLIIIEIMGWTNTAYVENSLGISPSLLNKFIKIRGTLRKRDALKIADRVRSFLKSEDQATAQKPVSRAAERQPKPVPVAYAAEQWILVPATSDAKQKINLISVLLDSIIAQTKGANAP